MLNQKKLDTNGLKFILFKQATAENANLTNHKRQTENAKSNPPEKQKTENAAEILAQSASRKSLSSRPAEFFPARFSINFQSGYFSIESARFARRFSDADIFLVRIFRPH